MSVALDMSFPPSMPPLLIARLLHDSGGHHFIPRALGLR